MQTEAAPSIQARLTAPLQGKALTALKPKQIEEVIAAYKLLKTECEAELTVAEREARSAVARVLNAPDSEEQIDAADAAIEPLRRTLRRIDAAVAAAVQAQDVARRRERDEAITAARAQIEAHLAPRLEAAVEIEKHAREIGRLLGVVYAEGVAAIHGARDVLRGDAQVGFRMSSTAAQGFRPDQIQRELMQFLTMTTPRVGDGRNKEPLWRMPRDEAMPYTGVVRPFSEMTRAWHLELLNAFEERYESSVQQAA